MTFLLLLIIYLIIFTFLSWKNQRWAIFLILAALPSYAVRFNIGNIPMTLLEEMILILFFIWVARKTKLSLTNKRSVNDWSLISNFQFLISNKISQSFGSTQDKLLNFLISNLKFTLPITIFLLSATISIFISPNKLAALGIWKAYFIEPVLFLIVFIDVLKENKNFYNFIASALSIPALYISIFAIYQKFTGFLVPLEYWQNSYHRVTSFFSYPNAIGLLLAPIVVILFGALISPFPFSTARETRPATSLRLRIYFFTVAILSIAAIIFAKSEGAIIALIAGAFIFIFLLPARRDEECLVSTTPRKIKNLSLIITIIVISLSAGVYFKYGKEWNLLFSKTNLFKLDNACDNSACEIYQKLTFQDVSGTLRRQMWQETFAMLKNRPVFGAGLAGYQETMKPYHTKNYVEIYLYPHNIILNFWSETGLLGLIAFIWIIILFFCSPSFARLRRQEEDRGSFSIYSTILIATMSVILIQGLVDAPYFKNDLAILFWVIWGMMILLL